MRVESQSLVKEQDIACQLMERRAGLLARICIKSSSGKVVNTRMPRSRLIQPTNEGCLLFRIAIQHEKAVGSRKTIHQVVAQRYIALPLD